MTDEPQRTEEARDFGFDTRQVHAGQRPDPNTGARAVPIFQTTSYVFEDPESAAAYFNLQEYGNTYSRIMNPTVAVFEERMANLEGGCGAVAFASGIAAQAAALFTLLQPGDHVVASSALYGGTVNQFKHLLRKMNVELTWVDPDDPDAWRGGAPREHQGVLRRDDRQPGRQRARHRDGRRDRARARRAADRRQHLRDAVPVPADRVGRRHRRPLGDEVHRRPRHEHRRRRRRLRRLQLVERTLSGRRRAVARLPRPRSSTRRSASTATDEAARRDAARPRRGDEPVQRVPVPAGARDAVAADGAPRRERAGGRRRSSRRTSWRRTSRYPGLPTSRYRPLVDKYLPRGAGAVFSFDCEGGREAGQDFIRGVTLWSHLANVGDAKSLIIHPASTTHRQLSDDELRAAGVGPGTIRLSVGIESIDDLIWDLEQGFARVAAAA